MQLHSFQELTTRIVNLSTRDKKPISVTWSGTGAYTNTKTVNIPTLPSGTILTPSQLSIWLGYVIHEGPGHQSHTDLSLYEATCHQRNNPQFSYILNLLEDIRIENADIKIYPGDRKYLNSVHIFVDQKIPLQLANSPDIMGLIYKQLFVKHRNLDTYIIKGNLDPETSNLISEIDLCFSTRDCINLADKVVAYLQQKKQQEQQQNQDQNQDETNQDNSPRELASDGADKENSNNQNKDQDNQGDNNESSKEDSPQNGEETINNNGESSNERSKDGSNSGNENNSQSRENQTNSGQESLNPSYSFDFSNYETNLWQKITEVKNIIQSLKDQNETNNEITLDKDDPDTNLNNKSIFPPNNISNDRIYVPSDEDLDTYNQTRTSCTSQILALKKMFRIYLQAQTKKSQIRGLEEGKLDTQRLHIASTGQTTIFKDNSLKLLPETAIELMIDMSGSMNADLSRTSAIILSEALNSIPQIKLSISGFTTNHLGRDSYFSYSHIPPNSGRQDGMDILQFKNFSEPYQKCKAKLGAITNTGNTPLGDAYGKSLEHIILRPEPRRIIFLITDGQPEFPKGRNHSDFLLMKKIHLTAQRYNIQTLGLGIGRCEFLSKYFDKAINITKVNDLPKNLLEALKSFI